MAAWENDLSPYHSVITVGTWNKDFLLERSARSGLYCVNNSIIYKRANLWKHWYANKSTLKLIWDWIGNQCNQCYKNYQWCYYYTLILLQFVKFANIEEDTPSYHRRYDFFISKFSSMCHNNNENMSVRRKWVALTCKTMHLKVVDLICSNKKNWHWVHLI